MLWRLLSLTVENEDIGATVKNLDDLNRLLFGYRHFVDLLRGVDIKAVLRADLGNLFGNRFDVKFALFIESENDVLSRGEKIYQLEMLMDHIQLVTAEGLC